MTEQPWKSEPSRLDFEADGLPCVMRRGYAGVWCGYVGIPAEHPLYGLPTNHPLKLPSAWFEHRRGLEGASAFDLFLHAVSGGSIEDACPISLAFQVHGGVNYAGHAPPSRAPDNHWWFGFDCGHAGDHMPDMPGMSEAMGEMIDSLPAKVRGTMRQIMAKQDSVYRDQQYVVSECQSLAAQLIAIVRVIEGETNERADHRRD